MANLEKLSDEALVSLCQTSRDPEERRQLLGSLISRYQRRVGLWCLRFSGNPDDAADLAQEIFLQITLRVESFGGHSRFSTWLYSVVRNHCLNHFNRKKKHVRESLEASGASEVADPRGSRWLETLEARSSHRELLELMNRTLDETERQVMVLHYGQEIALEPLTRLLQLENASGAKAFIVSAKRKLKVAIQRQRARGNRNLEKPGGHHAG